VNGGKKRIVGKREGILKGKDYFLSSEREKEKKGRHTLSGTTSSSKEATSKGHLCFLSGGTGKKECDWDEEENKFGERRVAKTNRTKRRVGQISCDIQGLGGCPGGGLNELKFRTDGRETKHQGGEKRDRPRGISQEVRRTAKGKISPTFPPIKRRTLGVLKPIVKGRCSGGGNSHHYGGHSGRHCASYQARQKGTSPSWYVVKLEKKREKKKEATLLSPHRKSRSKSALERRKNSSARP